jgi:hypothetical protein
MFSPHDLLFQVYRYVTTLYLKNDLFLVIMSILAGLANKLLKGYHWETIPANFQIGSLVREEYILKYFCQIFYHFLSNFLSFVMVAILVGRCPSRKEARVIRLNFDRQPPKDHSNKYWLKSVHQIGRKRR